MEQVLVAVYDKVAQKINDPFCTDNFETAKRTIQNSLRNTPALRILAPDLELRQLAVIDFSTGFIVPSAEDLTPTPLVDLIPPPVAAETETK